MTNWPDITTGTLTPAYGRDYKSEEAAQAAFFAGKDFRWNHPQGSTYCSVRDYPPGSKAKIRYNALQDVTIAIVE